MKQIVLIAISTLVLWSCNNNSETTHSNEEANLHEEHQHEAHHHEESSEPLELNQGEKWLVNDEMKPFVEKGEELVNTYVESNETDYPGLAKQIKEQNQQLITSCTMEGKSHDELHKWLHPHMELIEALGKASNENEANEIVMKLQESNALYQQYFK